MHSSARVVLKALGNLLSAWLVSIAAPLTFSRKIRLVFYNSVYVFMLVSYKVCVSSA